jgi:uncharacterized protein
MLTSAALAQILDAPSIVRAMVLYAEALERFRPEIDSLNVFPVPDGDTGTNLMHTQRAVAEALSAPPAERPGASAAERDGAPPDAMTTVRETVAHAALNGARGNSGVILSQVLRSFCSAIPDAGADGTAVAAALSDAAAAARRAVAEPREGTVLTVLDEAAAAAAATSGGPGSDADAGAVLEAALAAARAALARTTEQLPELRDAGVVDAGGKGAVLLLDALAAAVTGRAPSERPGPPGPLARPAGGPGASAPARSLPFPFEVEFVLEGPTDPDVEALRAHLRAMGDSLAIVGGDARYRVHVHTDRPDDVLAAGRAAGAVRDPAVVSLDEQVAACLRGAD